MVWTYRSIIYYIHSGSSIARPVRSFDPVFLDHVGRFLADHECHRVGVTTRYERHDRRVHHPKPSDATYPQLWIDHGFWVRGRSHLARAHLVVQVCGQLSDGATPVRVRPECLVFTARERHRQQRGSVFLECLGFAHCDCLQYYNQTMMKKNEFKKKKC